jgi:hypothetical protein
MLKQIKKELIISCVLLGKLKPMNGLVNLQKARDKLVHKWKNKQFLLIQEMISQCSH